MALLLALMSIAQTPKITFFDAATYLRGRCQPQMNKRESVKWHLLSLYGSAIETGSELMEEGDDDRVMIELECALSEELKKDDLCV